MANKKVQIENIRNYKEVKVEECFRTQKLKRIMAENRMAKKKNAAEMYIDRKRAEQKIITDKIIRRQSI